jgi:uracil-DNA glycosylase
MKRIDLPQTGTFVAWRQAARSLLLQDACPRDVLWHFDPRTDDLFDVPPPIERLEGATPISRRFIGLAEAAVCHVHPERFALLYEVLYELRRRPSFLDDSAEPRIARLLRMERAVRRDSHKMTAFVRFKDVGLGARGRRRFFAWFEPDHFIVEHAAPFFARRFADMDWTIATPNLTAHHEDGRLRFDAGATKPDIPQDAADDLWRVYYASIFNPARLKVRAMTREMPRKYWNNLPEAGLIPALILSAEGRAREMIMAQPTVEPLRSRRVKESREAEMPLAPAPDETPATVKETARQAAGCTRCDLYRHATQRVFGEGPESADIMFVGEQPGDKEDLQGRPFVGPAGQLFDQLLMEAGIDRSRAYVTNAVKHFKFEPRGKFRLHKKPDAGEVTACKWWLNIERTLLKPKLIVALGATAAQSLTGSGAAILKRQGTFEALDDGTPVLITLHPSALLRIPNANAAAAARGQVISDLLLAARQLKTETSAT